MNRQIKIYIETDNFKPLVLNSNVLVDKSLFIKEFLESEYEVSLITRPRRWGKSLNMSMLEYFLKLELDPAGNPLSEEDQVNRKLFTGGKTGKVSKRRADLLLIPKSDSKYHQALVVEYKIAKKLNALEQTAKEGLAQINEKAYDIKVKTHLNITSILKICMAFYGNKIEIKYQVDSINTTDKN
jgi:hypothetical protein